MDRRTLLTALGGLPLLACAPRTLGLQDVIDRNVEARGGAAALDAVRSCAIELEINEGGQTIPLRYYASIDRLARVDVMVGGQRAYSEGVDSQGVWLWPGDAPAATPSVAEGAANALLHGVEMNLVGLHHFQERGSQLTLQAPETIDGVEYQVIECIYPTTHVTNFYLDPASWQIARRRDRRAYHPDADTTQQNIETRFSDFQAVDGVTAAHLNEDYDLDSRALISSARVLTRRLNPDLPEGLFERSYTPV
jgi:hypothetical protein